MQARRSIVPGALIAAVLATTAGVAPFARSPDGGERSFPVFPPRPSACDLTPHERNWLRRSIDAWDRVRSRVLRLAPAPTPLVILFDARCEYRIDPDSVRVTGQPHGGRLLLPNGQRLAPAPVGFASLAAGDSAPFLVMALRAVWEADSTLVDEDWDQFLTRSFVHEMTHARLLPALALRLRAASGLAGMNDLDDDVIQERFDTVAAFRGSVQREIRLLYDAALARTAAERRNRALVALRAIKARRERFYGGEAAPWAYVEQLLLDLEGTAEFAEFSYLRLTVPRVPLVTLVERVRGDRSFWSQDEGLGMYLLLDALRPDWFRETFGPEPRSAIELIDESLAPAASGQKDPVDNS